MGLSCPSVCYIVNRFPIQLTSTAYDQCASDQDQDASLGVRRLGVDCVGLMLHFLER
jgi:hypothetical protein